MSTLNLNPRIPNVLFNLQKKNPEKKTFDIYASTFELNELKSWDESFSTELYRPVLIKDLSLC